ncbi:19021_t:CDS:1, partial [Funneliformis geosporum]
ISGVLFILSLFPLLDSEELVKVTVQGKDKLFSKGAYFGYDLLGFIIIFVPI